MINVYPEIFINTTPCQFTESKTMNAIKYINHIDASRCEPNSPNGIHHMTIILSSNSLIEGRQWRIRLNDDSKGKGRNVAILSSDKKSAMFNNVNKFIGYCTTIDKPDKLIDVLVVCNNKIRNDDIFTIIDTFYKERINLNDIGIRKCEFTIMFDEVDEAKNLKNACEFMEKSSKYYEIINSIHLISATLYKKFWKKVKRFGLEGRFRSLRAKMEKDFNETTCPKKLIEDYRKLNEHNIIYVDDVISHDSDYKTKSCEYIKNIYNNFIKNKEYTIRLFAPPSLYTVSHEIIRDFFIKEKFNVVVINGTEKNIYFSDKSKISIDKFNEKYYSGKKDVEMYNTLKKLNELYSDTNMVITGFNCIQRGVTFQTIGFNFTDMIIPQINNLATSVQLIGRANGGTKYVKKHNIYIEKSHYENIEERFNYGIKLIESNPEEICETDFRDKTAKEKDMVRWEIPISIKLDNEEYKYITEKKGTSNNFQKDRIFNTLKRNNISIEGYKKAMWNQPIPENAYKKNIIPLLNAIEKKEKISLLHKKDKQKDMNLYSIYFDYKNTQVIIVKYNGDIPIEE